MLAGWSLAVVLVQDRAMDHVLFSCFQPFSGDSKARLQVQVALQVALQVGLCDFWHHVQMALSWREYSNIAVRLCVNLVHLGCSASSSLFWYFWPFLPFFARVFKDCGTSFDFRVLHGKTRILRQSRGLDRHTKRLKHIRQKPF